MHYEHIQVTSASISQTHVSRQASMCFEKEKPFTWKGLRSKVGAFDIIAGDTKTNDKALIYTFREDVKR